MARHKEDKKPVRRHPPAKTPEAREQQMISLAVDLAEEQLRAGTASSQVITHYLKLGSIVEQKRTVLIEQQAELMKAKTESLQSAKRVEELYANALDAMRRYGGSLHRIGEDDEDEDD